MHKVGLDVAARRKAQGKVRARILELNVQVAARRENIKRSPPV